MSTETVRLIRDGQNRAEGVMEVGEEVGIFLSLHYHHQNDSCIEMSNDESHFIFFNNCEGQSHKTVSTYHNF